MKQKIKITDKTTGKTTEGEVKTRNEMHFEVQKNTRAVVFTPKKGKGSYKRRPKHQKGE